MAFRPSIRNRADDAGAPIAIGRKDDYRFFAKYEVQRVDRLHRAAENWYLFAELRSEMRSRGGAADPTAFNTPGFLRYGEDPALSFRSGMAPGWRRDLGRRAG